MSNAEYTSPAACPACIATPLATDRASRTATDGAQEVHLSLPTIHCAACISGVENGLSRMAGVQDVRVNLTRKRATVRLAAGVDPQTLARQLSDIGYEAQLLDGATLSAGESDRLARDLLMRLGVAGFAMMNIMLLSISVWAGATDATRDLFHWISAAIALPTILFAGQPFFRNAWAALSHARLNMDVPISLALLLATGVSLYETAHGGKHAYFDAAVSLNFFLLAGRFLDQKMRSVARSAATQLAALEVPTALRLNGDDAETVSLGDVAVGDLLLVRPGNRVPVDGVIEAGASELDRAFLTGETDPVPVAIGAEVRAGEVNLTGPLTVRATAVGEDTLLHSLADLVSVAEEAKSKYNSLANRASRIYSPVVHLMALSGFLTWMWLTGGDVRVSIMIAVSLLIITCPCALGLAVPAVSTVASGKLFRAGLLIKHATALERLAEVDEVVFDKTGTLTLGRPTLKGAEGIAPEALALAAALARVSAHPRSVAIADAARALGLPPAPLEEATEYPGLGIEGIVGGRKVRLGRAEWAGDIGAAAPQPTGATLLVVDGGAATPFRFEDTIRPGAQALIAHLAERGLPVTLLSGDTPQAVAHLADQLGITTWRAGMLPHEKAEYLEGRAAAGQRVMMVGDGLNDTAAIATAHVSIAPASALEATRVAADVVLVSPDLSHIADALRIGGRARRRILENFVIAGVYNAISIPIAFLGFATPLAAAIAMSTSSIVVSLNALRTR
ncbi:MAG: cbb3-type cytochrome oxidase biogenesis copper-translocating ATPase CcoI [Rhodobacteraceae bacterium HLUCCA08]|nr:MAG: cbb3-type cytochrome oxidase biogenesis copper-translocating ATPase CcoI [Rhodobacteraceae bacterium HLUCCA08]